jgi:hypothetical protein
VEQIVAVLKQAEVGVPVAELIRKVAIAGLAGLAERLDPQNAAACHPDTLARPRLRRKYAGVQLQAWQ